MAVAVYRGLIADKKNQGVYGISLVNDPAMEGLWVTFSKNKKPFEIKLKEVKNEERTVCGVVMVPDFPVYRNDENGEYYIVFSKEVIKESAHLMLTNGFHHNSTIEHEDIISGVNVVESWIVEDPKNDKANFYGLETTAGTWCCKMKINDDNIWNNFVKTGKVKGFSIDGLFTFEKTNINLNSQKMKKGNVISMLKTLLSAITPEVKLKRYQSDDSKELFFEVEGEELKEGLTLYVISQASGENEEAKTIAPDGKYFIDGKEVLVDKDGIITSVKDDPEVTEEEIVEMMKTEFSKLSAPLQEQIKKLTDENVALKSQIVELEKQPASDPKNRNQRPDDTKDPDAEVTLNKAQARLKKFREENKNK